MLNLNATEGREDFSRFVVHLTKDSDNYSAEENLFNILKNKVIEARNSHCLFKHKFDQLHFTKRLKDQFNTVCFTETPISQLRYLVKEIPGRMVKLKPYGLIFWRDTILELGGNPATYISGYGTSLKNYLLHSFEEQFKGNNQFRNLKESEKVYYQEIIRYYSLINIIQDKHDFSWEREWRFVGDFSFNYNNIVAIIADDPDGFSEELKSLKGKRFKQLQNIPVIDLNWDIERVLEEFSVRLWNK